MDTKARHDRRVCKTEPWTNRNYLISIQGVRSTQRPSSRKASNAMPTEDRPRVQLTDGAHSIAELLQKYRPYLRLLAARQLDPTLATRLSASDIVQQTQLEAFRDCGLFRGETEEQFVAWLKAILRNNVAQATHRHILTQKRSVKREQLQPQPHRPSYELPGRVDSPSAAAMRDESVVKLAHAMESLTADQYEAIRLRYLEGYSLTCLAESLNRSAPAVAGLLKRGLRRLRRVLHNEMER